jgi:hypothetical protein
MAEAPGPNPVFAVGCLNQVTSALLIEPRLDRARRTAQLTDSDPDDLSYS